jgi:hypothetical protein
VLSGVGPLSRAKCEWKFVCARSVKYVRAARAELESVSRERKQSRQRCYEADIVVETGSGTRAPCGDDAKPRPISSMIRMNSRSIS